MARLHGALAIRPEAGANATDESDLSAFRKDIAGLFLKHFGGEDDDFEFFTVEIGDGDGEAGPVLGVPVIRKFPFAFDTPNLLTGAALYTPTVGDVLLDAWLQIDEAWDGTTPLADIGTFQTSNAGWFAQAFGAPDMTSADYDIQTSDGLLLGYNFGGAAFAQGAGLLAAASGPLKILSNGDPGNFAVTKNVPAAEVQRLVPAKFTAPHPIKVCVSQDGTITGDDPGSTQGAAILYLVTATPV